MRTLKYLLAFLVIQIQGNNLQAQSVAEIEPEPVLKSLSCDPLTSSFVIEGTSSLHDWEMISNSCKGKLEYNDGDNSINLEHINIKVGVTTLKSGKRIMDKKCYNALKHENHPNIIYRFKEINSISEIGNSKYKASLNGSLDIAGVVKPVNIDVDIELKDGIMNIKGRKPMKMTDYDIEPPTALLGTLKTGNDITIVFNLNFIVL
ncbi:YceI family protein [Aureitalea sp. L0-47]|uniref:YceI family protein n=1 Tax=Aureitalea sp. L0-47 TaxID=2816962 RepID=UPI002238102F|nr:YceI family protein [Aureitalea sp. L0-47]MCW5518506.1 YceI family protein [Aureitalea sp. L0-47]